MGCCTTKDNTREKVKTDKKSSCDTAQTENLKTASQEHSAEDCNDDSCKIHRPEESEQKSDDTCGCK